MVEQLKQCDIIERVRNMEAAFTALQEALLCDPKSILTCPSLREMWRSLVRYYESGEWLADYERDERGELPAGMRCGVLSEDGLYDLLYEIDHLTNGKQEQTRKETDGGRNGEKREKTEVK